LRVWSGKAKHWDWQEVSSEPVGVHCGDGIKLQIDRRFAMLVYDASHFSFFCVAERQIIEETDK
jgi:hypothetical protein